MISTKGMSELRIYASLKKSQNGQIIITYFGDEGILGQHHHERLIRVKQERRELGCNCQI